MVKESIHPSSDYYYYYFYNIDFQDGRQVKAIIYIYLLVSTNCNEIQYQQFIAAREY